MHFAENVFPDLARFIDEGCRVAIVTLINVDGSSPRPVGSMIGVASDGRSVGMITGGCAEKAIVEEALQCIGAGENRIVRCGAGSPYLDVVLPCGSGIDLLFNIKNANEIVRDATALHGERRTAYLAVDIETMTGEILDQAPTQLPSDAFTARYDPDYRILAFGEGANLIAFCSLAHGAGFDVVAFSPDAGTLEVLSGTNIAGRPIHREAEFAALEMDRFTAVITLFHEHEWEAPILHAALNAKTDYIGALGSPRTHQLRLDTLAALPATRQPASVIHGPVGLDIGAANPNEIAVSVLAEIVQQRRSDAR